MFRHFILPTLTVRGLTQSSSPTSVCLSALQLFAKSQPVCFCLLRPVRRLGSATLSKCQFEFIRSQTVIKTSWLSETPMLSWVVLTGKPEKETSPCLMNSSKPVCYSQCSGRGKKRFIRTWKTHNRKYHPFTLWPLLKRWTHSAVLSGELPSRWDP